MLLDFLSLSSAELREGEWMWNSLGAFVSLSTCLFTFALHFRIFRVDKCKMILNKRDSFHFSSTLTDREIEQHGQRLVQENKEKVGLSWQHTSSISSSNQTFTRVYLCM